MCGISAVAGRDNIAPILVESLMKLEYRGYDSCGIFVYDGNEGVIKKNIGEVRSVDASENFSTLNGHIGIAHTRWATHGKVAQENAHPFFSEDTNFALVHNGIISNFLELRDVLKKDGFRFSSETDSEVFVHLMQKLYAETGSVEEAFVQGIGMIQGHFSLVLFSTHEPDKIFAVKRDTPLILGIGKTANYIASDINAFLPWTRDAVMFDDSEYIILSNSGFVAKNLTSRQPVTKEVMSIQWSSDAAQKGGFEHFMLKEIFEQPETVRKALSIPGNFIEDVSQSIIKYPLNTFLGVGTTYYVAMYGCYLFKKITGRSIQAYSTDEAAHLMQADENTHFVFISQSGETYDTRQVVKKAKESNSATSSIVNVVGSSISQMTDHCIFQASGPEISVVSTKAALSQMIILHRLALKTAYSDKLITAAELDAREKKIYDFSAVISRDINRQSGYIVRLVEKYIGKPRKPIANWLYLGKGIFFPVALEAALKMKEITYLHAEGMSAGFLKHGTLSLVDKTMGTFFFMPSKKDRELYLSTVNALHEVKARDGIVLCFGDPDDAALRGACDDLIELPDIDPELLPYYELIISQLFAYYSAIKLQRNIDKPRNLAKSVTVA